MIKTDFVSVWKRDMFENVPMYDATQHDGPYSLRVAKTRTDIILHDQLRGGGHTDRVSCWPWPQWPYIRTIQGGWWVSFLNLYFTFHLANRWVNAFTTVTNRFHIPPCNWCWCFSPWQTIDGGHHWINAIDVHVTPPPVYPSHINFIWYLAVV